MESVKQSIYIHEKSITELKFHDDGDVFFAASKDFSASMIDLKGSVIGTFDGHSGAITTLDSFENNLMTSGLDFSLKHWDILTGKNLVSVNMDFIIRGLNHEDQIYFCTDNSMNAIPSVGIFDPRAKGITILSNLNDPGTKIFKSRNFLIISTTNGKILKYDIRNNTIVNEIKPHQDRINSLKPSACRSFFITSSTDSSSKIIDTDSLEIKKTFDMEEPINSAAIFNTNDKVICAGGINARDVTTTKGKSSFDTNVFDIVTQQKIGCYTTHFGTINSLDIHPKGKFYISGGEDGKVCLVKFGDDFKNAPFTSFES